MIIFDYHIRLHLTIAIKYTLFFYFWNKKSRDFCRWNVKFDWFSYHFWHWNVLELCKGWNIIVKSAWWLLNHFKTKYLLLVSWPYLHSEEKNVQYPHVDTRRYWYLKAFALPPVLKSILGVKIELNVSWLIFCIASLSGIPV